MPAEKSRALTPESMWRLRDKDATLVRVVNTAERRDAANNTVGTDVIWAESYFPGALRTTEVAVFLEKAYHAKDDPLLVQAEQELLAALKASGLTATVRRLDEEVIVECTALGAVIVGRNKSQLIYKFNGRLASYNTGSYVNWQRHSAVAIAAEIKRRLDELMGALDQLLSRNPLPTE